MNLHIAALLGAVLFISASRAWSTDADSSAKTLVAEVCSSCHRSQSDSSPALVPALMGQQKSYLAWQLRAYRLGFRDDPQAHGGMWQPAGSIDDPLIAALAEYYASQLPMLGKPGPPALIARGKDLYRQGNPSQNITGCTYCHGENGEGNGIFPRLAGQRADYLSREMSLIQEHLRNIGIMHSTVEGLSQDDITAAAIFLQSK